MVKALWRACALLKLVGPTLHPMNRPRFYFVAAVMAILAVAADGACASTCGRCTPTRPIRPLRLGSSTKTGKYDYDATDHHGPSLYWLTLPSLALGGAKDLADSREVEYRIVPAPFGLGLVGLLLLLIDGLGKTAVVVAAL